MTPPANDQAASALLQQVAQGSVPAMQQFYQQFERTVYRYAMAQLSNPFDAAEVLNDVMLEVWRQAGRFEGRSAVSTWLLGMARHKALDRLRARQRHASEELPEDVQDHAPQAEQVLAAAQDAQRVRDCMTRLPVVQREVMHLAFFEDMGYEAIAALMQCPPGTVKSRVHHAKEALKKCLSQWNPMPL